MWGVHTSQDSSVLFKGICTNPDSGGFGPHPIPCGLDDFLPDDSSLFLFSGSPDSDGISPLQLDSQVVLDNDKVKYQGYLDGDDISIELDEAVGVMSPSLAIDDGFLKGKCFNYTGGSLASDNFLCDFDEFRDSTSASIVPITVDSDHSTHPFFDINGRTFYRPFGADSCVGVSDTA